MAIYKISYVVIGSDHPGGIVNADRRPMVGDKVQIGDQTYETIEVFELMPPRKDFHFIHVTCQACLPDKNEGSQAKAT